MKPKKLIVIGGEKAIGIAECINHNRKYYDDHEFEFMGLLNDLEEGNIRGFPVLGKTRDCGDYFHDENIFFSFAIHLIGKNQIGESLFDKLKIPTEKLATVIHRSVVKLDSAKLDPGVTVLAQSYISSVHLEKGVYVSPNCTVCHGSKVGELSYISMGSVVGSMVTLGNSVSVGMGANIIEKSTVGDYAVVAAGAVVIGNVPAECIYGGVPAKFIRKINRS